MGIPQKSDITVAEYLELEVKNEVKYEFHDGEIYAMSGGTLNHAIISGNTYSAIKAALKGKGSNCKPFNSDARTFIKILNTYVYPDTSVVCGDIEQSEKGHAICNPILIVEVLSRSTSGYDRGDKFHKYQKIPSLQEYVLIEQENKIVDIYFRQPKSDLWRITRFEGEKTIVRFESIDLDIEMASIYDGVLKE